MLGFSLKFIVSSEVLRIINRLRISIIEDKCFIGFVLIFCLFWFSLRLYHHVELFRRLWKPWDFICRLTIHYKIRILHMQKKKKFVSYSMYDPNNVVFLFPLNCKFLIEETPKFVQTLYCKEFNNGKKCLWREYKVFSFIIWIEWLYLSDCEFIFIT